MAADKPKRPAPPLDDDRPASERETIPPSFGADALDLAELARGGGAPIPDRSGPRPVGPHRALIAELGDRYASGDIEGALALAEAVDPADPAHPIAAFCIARCHAALEDVFVQRVGGLSHVPRVALSPAALRSVRLDHREGFVLALVDGRMCVEEIVDVSSMSRFDALKILDGLVARAIID